MWIKLIFALVFVISTFLIFDARPIVRKYFTLHDRNKSVNIIRCIGVIIYLILIYIYIVLKQKGINLF